MRLALAVTAAILVLSSPAAWAERTTEHQDRFMNTPVKETVYATDHHMGFSLRSTIIRWLGGVTIVDERDLRASEQEKWWGQAVPLLPADAMKSGK